MEFDAEIYVEVMNILHSHISQIYTYKMFKFIACVELFSLDNGQICPSNMRGEREEREGEKERERERYIPL